MTINIVEHDDHEDRADRRAAILAAAINGAGQRRAPSSVEHEASQYLKWLQRDS